MLARISVCATSSRAAHEHYVRFQANPEGYKPEGEAPRGALVLNADLARAFLLWSRDTKRNTPRSRRLFPSPPFRTRHGRRRCPWAALDFPTPTSLATSTPASARTRHRRFDRKHARASIFRPAAPRGRSELLRLSRSQVLRQRDVRMILVLRLEREGTSVERPMHLLKLGPGAVLLFTEETLKFEAIGDTKSMGNLREPGGQFLVIDGQHRVAGLHFFQKKPR